MRGRAYIVHAVAALAALSSCLAENKSPPGRDAEQDAPRPSSPKAEPSSSVPAAPDVLQPDPARATLASLVDGLDVAWYDPNVTKDHLELQCHSGEWETRDQRPERAPCTTEVESLHVVDAQGTAAWTVHEQRGELRLVRAGAQLPSVATPVLALIDPPAADARLIPLLSSPPSARPKSVVLALVDAVAKIDDVQLDGVIMRPQFELHGRFGGNADTLVVFEVDESFEEIAGLQVIAAFAGDQLEGRLRRPCPDVGRARGRRGDRSRW
ncbi:MAG: hypothetical protein HC927_05715 [Deltaproteobacteria bacterium]|nr:hypothetical protein [Deltaproteobacteria bacterium]